MELEQTNNDIQVKYEIINNLETFLEEDAVKPEKDIPEYVNVNTFSKVKLENEDPENVQETFRCSQCPSKYKKIAYLTIHEALHDPQRFCPICYETFTCKKKFGHHLNQHIKEQMKEDKRIAYSCGYCQKCFNTKKKFTLHVRVHTNERPHKCDICGEGFKQLGTLRDHHVTHTKEKRFACEICNGCFTTSSSLKRHKKKMHDKGKTINCKHCDSKFLNMAAFRAHRSNVHPDVGYRRTCPLCLEIFRTRCTYQNHKQVHDEQLPKGNEVFKYYLCILCGDKSLSLNLYLEHRLIHLNYTKAELEEAKQNNLFKCKLCPKEFMIRSSLFKHMDIHMEKVIKCDFCETFFTYYGLNTHMRTTHKMLRCRVCHKVLTGRAKLYSHYRKYHPTVRKPFACGICGKQYVARNHLNLHFKLIHDKNAVKNFRCAVCGKRFLTRFFMASHMACVHERKVKYKCSSCEVVAYTKKEMSIHNLIHKESAIEVLEENQSNVVGHKRFQCKMCKKIFLSSKSCKIHVMFKNCRNFLDRRKKHQTASSNRCVKFTTEETLNCHMGQRSAVDYKCRFCSKTYKMVRTMRRHIQLHHPGEKIYKCDSCDEEFDKMYEYNKHNCLKHRGKLEPTSTVQINRYGDYVLDAHDSFAVNEFDSIKKEPEDTLLDYLNVNNISSK